MSPQIFLDDFERTEYSDALHAIVGRALIIATRFDATCTIAAIGLGFKQEAVFAQSDEQREILFDAMTKKYGTLNASIKAIGLPQDIAAMLHRARRARNTVAHELARDLTGRLDRKVNESSFISWVTQLVSDLADGDAVASTLTSIFNRDPLPRQEFMSSYKSRVVQWVIEK